MSHFRIDDPIYGRTVNLFHGPLSEPQSFFTKNGSDWNLKEFKDANGVSLFDNTLPHPLIAIWLPPRFKATSIDSQATLAHECLHITHYVLDYAGMHLTESSSEAFTYYMGWLYRECMLRLSRRGADRLRVALRRKQKCQQAQPESSSTAQCSNGEPATPKAQS